MPSSIYTRSNTELMDYYFYNRGYRSSLEVGYYIDFSKYADDITTNWSTSVRRHYKASEKNGIEFKELESIALFYDVMLDNYKKFGTLAVHSL